MTVCWDLFLFLGLTEKKTGMSAKKTTKAPKKRLRQGNQIQASSLIEVKEGLDRARERLRRPLKLPGEGFTVGKTIEAFCAYCVTRPHDQQLEMAREGQAIIERLRLLKEPGPPLDWKDSASPEKGSSKFIGVEDGDAGRKGRVPPQKKGPGIKSLGSQIDTGAIGRAECSDVDA